MAKILVVDDDPNVRKLLQATLRVQGHDVVLASNGEEGIAAVSECRPDLILLDIMMPGMSGVELCRFLRSWGREDFIPIIMLTARADTESIVEGLDSGADEYLTKPFDSQELMARVRSMLRLKRMHSDLTEAQRVAAIAQMAISLKHEISNPLQAVLGFADVLLERLEKGDPRADSLKAIILNAERIKELVNRLSQLKSAQTTTYIGETKMIDLGDRQESE